MAQLYTASCCSRAWWQRGSGGVAEGWGGHQVLFRDLGPVVRKLIRGHIYHEELVRERNARGCDGALGREGAEDGSNSVLEE